MPGPSPTRTGSCGRPHRSESDDAAVPSAHRPMRGGHRATAPRAWTLPGFERDSASWRRKRRRGFGRSSRSTVGLRWPRSSRSRSVGYTGTRHDPERDSEQDLRHRGGSIREASQRHGEDENQRTEHAAVTADYRAVHAATSEQQTSPASGPGPGPSSEISGVAIGRAPLDRAPRRLHGKPPSVPNRRWVRSSRTPTFTYAMRHSDTSRDALGTRLPRLMTGCVPRATRSGD